MTDLVCAPGIHLAKCDGDVVILDVRTDRYAALMDIADALDLGPGGSVRVLGPLRAALIEAGILVEGQPDPTRRSPASPTRDLAPAPSGLSREAVRAAAVLTSSALRFRRLSLADLIAPLPVSTMPGETIDPTRLSDLIAAARAAWLWSPLEGQCLQRAFQLRALLRRHGLAVDWVFGVRTWPFAAHCWLQWEDWVLNDRLERVGRFTPILVA